MNKPNEHQEKAILEVADKLYWLAEVCGIQEDNVNTWISNVKKDVKEITGIELE